MNIVRNTTLAGAVIALVLLAGCASMDMGSILGGGSPQATTSEIRGTVDYVDTSNQFVALRDVTTTSGLASGTGTTTRVYYNTQTTVSYQNQTYRPDALERGDKIAARVEESDNRLLATSMTVTYNASGTTGSSTTASTVSGTVRTVDSSRRQIELNRSGSLGDIIVVEYETSTPVTFQNRQYRPEELERGDEIDARVRNLGGGRLLAESIDVIRSVGTDTTSSSSVIRGTVGYIDTSRRTIELKQTSGSLKFTPRGGSSRIVQYDANTVVEFEGRTYALTSLDPGDVVDVTVRDLGGNSYLAQRVVVVRDVNALR
ncbi:MAG: DUF5666 domain-containing protein [Thermoanaerobaculia bacterium]